ncbi:hypothetical protein [Desulfurobacterium indicum]|uniref:Uncharacterized protein n=1 Tax=Desulfurobacterium indicum TaxID=1914305 RepID=A0A1R1MMG3_9BACT|nr:hypothetical protein [Desulfurobacterium indicum]OMH40956.1 hypothetical protein BLW93_02635 [Desulfurobacterium indicum]
MKGLNRDIEELLDQGLSFKDVRKHLEKKYKKELSFTAISYFTYFFIFGFPVLIVAAVFLKFGNLTGTAYYIDRLILLLGAMATLKGFVGHFVSVFLRREKFEEEFKKVRRLREADYGKSSG